MLSKFSFNKLNITLFILYAFILAFFSLSSFPSKMSDHNLFPYLCVRPISEDGFYMLTVADNIAKGKGITYNYNQPTTGIQPLATFVYAGIAKFTYLFNEDKALLARSVIVYSALLELLFMLVIFKITSLIAPYISKKKLLFLSGIFTILNFNLFLYFNNGLETGLYLTCLGCTIIYSFNFINKPDYKHATLFGLIAGITALARLDFLAIFAVFILASLIGKKIEFNKVLTIGSVTLLTISPWLLYVFSVTGTIFQSSILAQSNLALHTTITEKLYFLITALLQHLLPLFFTSFKDWILFTAFPFMILFIIYMYKKGLFKTVYASEMLHWFLGIFFLVPLYFTFSAAHWFYIRYFTPLFLIFIPYTIILLNHLYRINIKRPCLIVSSICLMLFFGQTYHHIHAVKVGNHQCMRINFIKKNFKSDERIGVWQSGATGYFCPNVVNLDGKMNSVADKYNRADNSFRYIDSTRINVLIEWKIILKSIDTTKWKLAYPDIGDGTSECYIREQKS